MNSDWDRLPKLVEETRRQLEECDAELAKLPAQVSSEPVSFVLDLVIFFSKQVKIYVDGQTSAAELVQDTHRVYERFCTNIRRTAPCFLPHPDKKIPTVEEIKVLLKLEDGEEDSKTWTVEECMNLQDVRDRIKR